MHFLEPVPSGAAESITSISIRDEGRILSRLEAIAKHLRALRLHAEALAVENLGTMIEGYAEHYRPRRAAR